MSGKTADACSVGSPLAGGRVDGHRIRSALNELWVSINGRINTLVGGGPRTTLFDPAFLHWHYFSRNLRRVRGYATGTLVDLGCGRKPFRAFFNVDRYLGLDRPEFTGGIEGVAPLVDLYGDACRVPVQTRSVHTVTAFQILEHLKEPKALLQEAHRILAAQGVLILTCPQAYPIHGHPHDYYRYTSNGLRYLLDEAGFDVVSIERNGSFWAHMGLMLNIYLFYHLFETRKRYAARVVLGIAKLVLLPALLLVIATVNLVAWLLNRCDDNEYFTSNYTVVARTRAV